MTGPPPAALPPSAVSPSAAPAPRSTPRATPPPKPAPASHEHQRSWTFERFFTSSDERDAVLENLALMVEAGMPIVGALRTLERDVASKGLSRTLAFLRAGVDEGRPIWELMQETQLVPAYAVSLVRIGEEAGQLPENLKVVADEQRKDRQFRAKVGSALAYPVIVIVVAFIVGLGVAWFVLPRLTTVFSSLNVELPLATRALLAVARFMSQYGLIAVPAIVFGTVLLGYLLFVKSGTKQLGERLILALPPTRRVLQEVQIARLSFLLGTLLKAGVPIEEALVSVTRATDSPTYEHLLATLSRDVAAGSSFQASFARARSTDRLIPPTIQQLIVSAEQTGKLPDTLLRIGATYEEKLDLTTKTLATALEPLLLVVIWFGVLFVAVAVLMPIYNLIGTIQ